MKIDKIGFQMDDELIVVAIIVAAIIFGVKTCSDIQTDRMRACISTGATYVNGNCIGGGK